jgi:hypothetical protein
MEQEAGWAQEVVCRRQKSLARAENRKTIPRSSNPQPSHCTNHAILSTYTECFCITSNTLNKDPKLVTVTILKLTKFHIFCITSVTDSIVK